MNKTTKLLQYFLLLAFCGCLIAFAVRAIGIAAHNREYRSVYKNTRENQRFTMYKEEIPIDQIDKSLLYQSCVINEMAADTSEVMTYTLKKQITYYEIIDGKMSESYILPEGTEVVMKCEGLSVLGYGTALCPTYSEKWRYGRPFISIEEYSSEDKINEDPTAVHYYVKTADIKRICDAWNSKRFPDMNMKELSYQTEAALYVVDRYYFLDGIYDSGWACRKVFDLPNILLIIVGAMSLSGSLLIKNTLINEYASAKV